MVTIGSCCKLYKTCKICKTTKLIYEFSSAGNGRRRTYCKKCKEINRLLPKQPINNYYSYDISSLIGSDINVTRPTAKGKLIRYKINREMAITHVKGGVAGITSKTSIRRFYSRSEFRKMILERDGYKCAYCGKRRKRGLTIDHIVAKVKGGLSTFTNCVCACKKCNVEKDKLSITEYLKKNGLICQGEISKKEQEILSKAYIPSLPLIINSDMFLSTHAKRDAC